MIKMVSFYSLTLLVLTIARQFSTTSGETGGLTSITCDNDEQCSFPIPNSYCDTDSGSCQCSDGFTIGAGGFICVRVVIGTPCTAGPSGDAYCNTGVLDSVCHATYAVCDCPDGYDNIYIDGDPVCVAAVENDNACTTCIDSGGVCRDVSGDGTPDQCGCPEFWVSSDPPNSLTTGCDVRNVPTGGRCSADNAICDDPHATCEHAGDLSPDFYCQCGLGYVAIRRPYDPSHGDCRLTINKVLDPSCGTCESNKGECYSLDDSATYSGCLCEPTRSSSSSSPQHACDTNHFTVRCSGAGPLICFIAGDSPIHQQLACNFKDGKSLLYLRDHADDPYCHFQETDEGWCMDAERSLACGIVENDRPESRSFSGWATLQYNALYMTAADLELQVYCNYQKQTQASTGGTSVTRNKIVGMSNVGTSGTTVRADLEMTAISGLGTTVGSSGVRLGDMIKLQIATKDNKGVFEGIRAEVCIVSDHESLESPETTADTFIMNNCPVPNAMIANARFAPVNGDPTIVQTGFFPVPQFPTGDYVFFHCATRTCMDSSECDSEDCSSPGERKRRETGKGRLTLPKTLHQLAVFAISKRSLSRSKRNSMYDLDKPLESPDLEESKLAIRVLGDNNARYGTHAHPHRLDMGPDRTGPNYGRERYVDDVYHQLQFDRLEQSLATFASSWNAMMIVSVVATSIVALLQAAVIFIWCFVVPRRPQNEQYYVRVEMIK